MARATGATHSEIWRVLLPSYVFFPPGWCFFYLVTRGWIIDISLFENSVNEKKYTRYVVRQTLDTYNVVQVAYCCNIQYYNKDILFCTTVEPT